MKNIKKIIRFFVPISLVGLIFLWFWSDIQPRNPTISKTCKLTLQVFIREGTKANHKISGSVVVVDGLGDTNSNFNGTLSQEKPPSNHAITLYFDKPVIHFVISIQGERIFGAGTSEGTPTTCSGEAAGTQSGPTLDDLGDWQGNWKIEQKIIFPPSRESILMKWVYFGLIGLPVIFVLGVLVGKRSTKDE